MDELTKPAELLLDAIDGERLLLQPCHLRSGNTRRNCIFRTHVPFAREAAATDRGPKIIPSDAYFMCRCWFS
jgi:hypothetical protein